MSLTTRSVLLLCLATSAAHADDKADCVDAAGKAQDLRGAKQLVLAREALLTCAREVCPAVIKRDCVTWLQDVETALPTLVLSVKDVTGADVIEARVLLDGKQVAERITGTALTIDPGVHTVRIESNAYAPLEQQLVVREGEKNRLVEIRVAPVKPPEPEVKEPPPTPPAPAPQPPPTVVTEPPVTEAPVVDEAPHSSYRVAGIVSASAGGALLVVGSVFGFRARSQWHDAQDACGAGCLPDSDAYQLRDDARTSATISTVAIVGGVVGAVAGVALLVLDHREPANHPTTAAIMRAANHGVLGFEAKF